MSKVTIQDVETQGLTQEQVDLCLHKHMGDVCPWCHHDPAVIENVHHEDGSIYTQMNCPKCGAWWDQVAWIVGILSDDDAEWQYATGVEPGPVDYKALAAKLAEALSCCLDTIPAAAKIQWVREASASYYKAIGAYYAAVDPPDEHPGWDRLETALKAE